MSNDLPDITPPIVAPVCLMIPENFSFGPYPFIGPVAMVHSTRADDGAKVTSFIGIGEFTHARCGDCGEVDLERIDPDKFLRIIVNGWPDDWDADHQGPHLVEMLAEGLLLGLPWDEVKTAAENMAARMNAEHN